MSQSFQASKQDSFLDRNCLAFKTFCLADCLSPADLNMIGRRLVQKKLKRTQQAVLTYAFIGLVNPELLRLMFNSCLINKVDIQILYDFES